VIDLRLGDCLELMRGLDMSDVGAIITDPPYGMHKGDWDLEIPQWLHLVGEIPTACFCGVVGMRDYPTPTWIGAWVRAGSTQRNGKLRGFNNWEPILFYNITRLENDVFSFPNYHEDTGHPTTKPLPLMEKIISRMPAGTILDPFMGSGTTGVACVKLGRNFIGMEINETYYNIAQRRIAEAQQQIALPLVTA
jgi:site-specific DNA-methyltransferase (adenine-specific)